MIEALRETIQKTGKAFVIVGDGDPYYVLNDAGVVRRDRLFKEKGISAKVIELTAETIGKKALSTIVRMAGERIGIEQEEESEGTTENENEINEEI